MGRGGSSGLKRTAGGSSWTATGKGARCFTDRAGPGSYLLHFAASRVKFNCRLFQPVGEQFQWRSRSRQSSSVAVRLALP